MRSLRSVLLIGTAAATTFLIGLSALTTYVLVRTSLYREFDRLLAAKARSLAALIEQERDKVEVEFAEHPLPEFQSTQRPEYFQVWRADRTVVARSRSLKQGDLDRIGGDSDEPTFRTVALPDGRTGRLVGFSFLPRSEEKDESTRRAVTLVVARETTSIEETLATLALVLAAVSGATVVLIVGALAWVIHRGVAPVSQLAADIRAVDEQNLGLRFDQNAVPAELRPVVIRLNELLAKLAAVIDREKSFSADVAHELRTPLTGLRATLEVALGRQRTAADYREAMDTCLDICRRTQEVVETLLLLVRPKDIPPANGREDVQVARLLRKCWKSVAERARVRKLNDVWSVDDSLRISTDAGRLRIIVANLLENAAEHAEVGGTIRIELSGNGTAAELQITNTGSRVAESDIVRVFESFWRGDAARTGTDRHAGLGLSLCRKLTTSIGCEIAATSQLGGEFQVRFRFPGESVAER